VVEKYSAGGFGGKSHTEGGVEKKGVPWQKIGSGRDSEKEEITRESTSRTKKGTEAKKRFRLKNKYRQLGAVGWDCAGTGEGLYGGTRAAKNTRGENNGKEPTDATLKNHCRIRRFCVGLGDIRTNRQKRNCKVKGEKKPEEAARVGGRPSFLERGWGASPKRWGNRIKTR